MNTVRNIKLAVHAFNRIWEPRSQQFEYGHAVSANRALDAFQGTLTQVAPRFGLHERQLEDAVYCHAMHEAECYMGAH